MKPRRRGLSPLAYALTAVAALLAVYVVAVPAVDHFLQQRSAADEIDRLRVPPLATLIKTRGMEAMVVAWFFMLGGTFGSFINVVVYRIPIRLSIVWRSSRCPYCNTSIATTDNVPVFGWLKIRGRCRTCRLPISPRYPIVELVAALVFVSLLLCELAPAHATEFSGSIDSPLVAVVLNPLAGPIAAYALHCLLLCVLLVWALMEIDGHDPPLRTLVFADLVGLAAPAIWLFLPPPETAAETLVFDYRLALAGAAGGLVPSIVLALSVRSTAGSRRVTCATALAGGITTGLLLGWRAAVAVALLAALVQFFRAAIGRLADAPTMAKSAGPALFSAVWMLLVALPLLPQTLQQALPAGSLTAPLLAGLASLVLALAARVLDRPEPPPAHE